VADQFTPEQRNQLSAVGAASGLGCSIVATMLVFIGGGILLDQFLDTAPLLTLVGVALGLGAAAYQLWELAQIGSRDRPPPLTRGITKIAKPVTRGHSVPRKRHEVTDDARIEE
jgi:hypothetical protein